MKYLFILNDPPYGTERSYNALRLARALSKAEHNEILVFLMGDAAACAKAGQKVPQGYYSIGFMLESILRRNAQVGVCSTCLEARGIQDGELIEGARHSTLDQLAEWTEAADKVLVF